MRVLLVPAFGFALLAGCSHPANDATLTFSPAALKDCGSDTGPSSLNVHWNASKAMPHGGSVKLWINNKPSNQGIFGDDDKGTLWSESGAIASATTGRWIFPGTRITVTDASNGKVLTQLDVPAAPCH